MKLDGWDRKLRRLEKKLDAPEFEQGSTKIAWECLLERERKLIAKIDGVFKEYGLDPDLIPSDVLLENRELLLKGAEIMHRRIMDLYYSLMNCLLRNNLEKAIFWSRYHAFFTTTMNIVDMRRREEDQEAQFKEKYGRDWIDKVQEEYGDDWPEPDYSGLGERDINKALKNQVALDAGKRD